MSLRTLIETWRHDADHAMCCDGNTEKPCDGIQHCADDLEAALPSPATLVGLVSLRPSDGAMFVGGIEFSETQARRITSDLLELLPAPPASVTLPAIRDLRAASRVPQARALDWQSIETAPKDGSAFLGGWTHRIYGWIWGRASWCNDKYAEGGGYFVCRSGGEPTHWLVLPDPPASSRASEDETPDEKKS